VCAGVTRPTIGCANVCARCNTRIANIISSPRQTTRRSYAHNPISSQWTQEARPCTIICYRRARKSTGRRNARPQSNSQSLNPPTKKQSQPTPNAYRRRQRRARRRVAENRVVQSVSFMKCWCKQDCVASVSGSTPVESP